MKEKGRKARAIVSTDHNFEDGELITFVEVSQDYFEMEEICTFINEEGLEQDLEAHEFEWIVTEM